MLSHLVVSNSATPWAVAHQASLSLGYKLESRYAGETSTTLDMRADDTTLMAESEEELKSLLMKVKKESEKSWLKTQHSKNEDHGIWSHHLMANR